MNQTHIAPHLRESVFRTYEPLIREAVTSWPTESAFTIPTNVAPTTFVANFRNALLSLRKYNWSTDIDLQKMWSMGRDYVIAQDTQGTVWFRARGHAGRPNTLTSEVAGHAPNALIPSSVVPWKDSTEQEIRALCTLIHFNRAQGPFIITGQLAPLLVDDLQGTLNVALVYDIVKNQTVIT